MKCDLCELKDCKYKLVNCKSCHIPMIVLLEHRASFTEQEKDEIKGMFPGRAIRWEMRRISNHAHCHLL